MELHVAKNGESMSSRKRVRSRPIRRRLAALLVVPLLLLVGLWAFATFASVSAALARADFVRTVDDIGGPVGAVVETLRRERAATATVLGSRGAQGLEQLQQGQKATDGALSLFRRKALPASSHLTDRAAVQVIRDFDSESRRLGSLRAQVAARSITPLEAITRYNALSDSTARVLSAVLTDLARSTVWTLPGQTDSNGVKAYQAGVATLYGTQARDHMMREDAVVTLAQARGRWLSATEYAAFVQAAADRRRLKELSYDASSPWAR
jgi:hypothetical protein